MNLGLRFLATITLFGTHKISAVSDVIHKKIVNEEYECMEDESKQQSPVTQTPKARSLTNEIISHNIQCPGPNCLDIQKTKFGLITTNLLI